jgi:hypothetical protein
MLDDIDLTGIQDENARQLMLRLLNIIEALSADLREAQAQIQRLRDENNRLKGEQGKPKIKPTIRRRKSAANPAPITKAARKPRSRSTGSSG